MTKNNLKNEQASSEAEKLLEIILEEGLNERGEADLLPLVKDILKISESYVNNKRQNQDLTEAASQRKTFQRDVSKKIEQFKS